MTAPRWKTDPVTGLLDPPIVIKNEIVGKRQFITFYDGEVLDLRAPDLWSQLNQEQEGRCFYCNVEVHRGRTRDYPAHQRGEIEHKTPRLRGGTDDRENLVLACCRCNGRKGVMTAEEFFRVRALELEARAIREYASSHKRSR